jgi:hypothetical protein
MTGVRQRRLPADRSRARAAVLLALAAAGYTLAAWPVQPGFYDGIGGCSPVPYRWTSPPPALSGGNLKPLSGHATARVIGGETQGVFAFTDDNQVQLSVPAAGFTVPSGATVVTISIDPVSTYPDVTDFTVSTNVYRITAGAPLAKEAHIVLQYSDQLAAPSTIYTADDGGSTWRALPPLDSSQPCQLSAKTTKLGLFVAGYPRAATRPSGFTIGGAVLPIVAAAAVILVLLSAVPIAILRQRQARQEPKRGRTRRNGD